jgi:hypothetical protein
LRHAEGPRAIPFFRQPSARLHPFDFTAVDVAGPFKTKVGRSEVKRWLMIFQCSTVGAVLFKMIETMETSSFLLGVERFLAVRPRPSVIIADNGTNFTGGAAALQEGQTPGTQQIDLSKAQSHFNIKFKFAPPRAPHFQGLVERFVGSVKSAIHSAIHSHTLTDEELRTVFARAMGHFNNMPKAYTTKSEVDFHYVPLTPGHFLMGVAYSELQPMDVEVEKLTKTLRYNRVCDMLDTFWKRLVAELSTHLRLYNMWMAKTRGLKLGDIALLLDAAKQGATPLIRITQVETGLDGHIRRVIYFDGFKHFARAISSIAVLLPAEEEDTIEDSEENND